MHLVGFFSLQVAFLLSLLLAGLACWQTVQKKETALQWFEFGQSTCAALVLLASAILLRALAVRDFSFAYVAEYTDTFLPQFYAFTAFWAGQDGSLLFWALLVSLSGFVWVFTPAYRRQSPSVQVTFWLFFMAAQAFFFYLLTGPSNPFIRLEPAPAQGSGLNPLLQNPGMIFHPPLLFIGYAGFTVPCCLAFASWLRGDGKSWLLSGRNWILISWIFLTAGIVLGGWWSYMELGWGGYWAWDPVENASLIPWMSSSALLHTAIIGRQRKALGRSNVALIGLTLMLCFFATYLVRSGVIDSLHAFGGGGVGGPLLVMILLSTLISFWIPFTGQRQDDRPLSGMVSKQGLLIIIVWLLLAIGLVVMIGTMWPVISSLWTTSSIGLDAGFYNRVCLPLFTLFVVLLAFCPWLGWKGGTSHPKVLVFLAVLFALFCVLLAWLGYARPMPLVAAAMSLTCCVSIVLLFVMQPAVRRSRQKWGAFGVHLGIALMGFGIALSGPYQVEQEAIMEKGDSFTLQDYTITYVDHSESSNAAMARYQAQLDVMSNGKPVGRLTPERRMYRQFDQPFAEVSVIPSLGEELYATLLGTTEDNVISVKVSVNPVVNWIWIGGTLVCLLAFLALGGLPRRD